MTKEKDCDRCKSTGPLIWRAVSDEIDWLICYACAEKMLRGPNSVRGGCEIFAQSSDGEWHRIAREGGVICV